MTVKLQLDNSPRGGNAGGSAGFGAGRHTAWDDGPSYTNRADPYERNNSVPNEEEEVAGEKRLVWKGKGGPKAKTALQQPKPDGGTYSRLNAQQLNKTEIVDAGSELYPLEEVAKFLKCNRGKLLAFVTQEGLLRRVKMRKGQSAEFKPRNCVAGDGLKLVIAHFRELQGSALLKKAVEGKKPGMPRKNATP